MRCHQQIVHMGNPQLGWETRVDGSALAAVLVKPLASKVGKHEVFGSNSQRDKITRKQRRRREQVQHAWDSDSKSPPLLDLLCSLLLRGSDRETRRAFG